MSVLLRHKKGDWVSRLLEECVYRRLVVTAAKFNFFLENFVIRTFPRKVLWTEFFGLPNFFNLVVVTSLWVEDVNDDVVEIEHDPLGLFITVDV